MRLKNVVSTHQQIVFTLERVKNTLRTVPGVIPEYVPNDSPVGGDILKGP